VNFGVLMHLWIPQDHPARDDQDTFFFEGSAEVEQHLIDAIREMHEQKA
jgi:phenylalanyl-tRNA synthetase alpha subunit